MATRPSGRQPDELRALQLTTDYTANASGSVLAEFGNTRVLCTASVDASVPRFLKGKGQGWITAEYGMLPGSTHTRVRREATAGKQGGRTLEIQRLIGRSLRAAANLEALDGYSITLDCDVLQADGGTRTTSICGAWLAMAIAVDRLLAKKQIKQNPLLGQVAAISVGIFDGMPVLDLDYPEDSNAETDMNVVMNEAGGFIEIQGTAEGHAFQRGELDQLLVLAEKGIGEIVVAQNAALENWRSQQ